MGVIVLGCVLLAGVLMIAFGKMTDTTFGLWVGGLTVDAFGYGTANLVAKKFSPASKAKR